MSKTIRTTYGLVDAEAHTRLRNSFDTHRIFDAGTCWKSWED